MTTKNLQNGSDIRGIALPGIEGENPNLGEKETISLSKGYIMWLSVKTQKPFNQLKVAVGMDPRLSGPQLKTWIIETLVSYGVKVFDCGLASTPAMFMSTIFDEFSCDGAIMITASHLPFNRNGFKYFDKDGGLNKSDISDIIAYADGEKSLPENSNICACSNCEKETCDSCQPEEKDLMARYAKHLRQLIIDGAQNGEKPLEGMKIIVDAGNGGGGFYATKVLAPLGADISDSQFLEPDGNFPNHAPNPEDKKAMASICAAVKEKGSDFGLIFDTDVDRSAAVDGQGNPISRNEIVAMAAALIAQEHPGSTVVTDSITSDQLTVFIEQCLGLKHLRFKRGYKNVINKSIELNNEGIDSQLAIETSGHAAFKENYFLDDGAYLATKIVIKAAKLKQAGEGLDCLISSLEKPAEAREVRMKLNIEDFGAYGDNILAWLKAWVNAEDCVGKQTDPDDPSSPCQRCHCGTSLVEPNYEGVRINFDKDNGDGWALLRKSLHDPIMPLNIESNQVGGCDIIAAKLKAFLDQFNALDISAL